MVSLVVIGTKTYTFSMSDPKVFDTLPALLSHGALFRESEYAWELDAFLGALQNAPGLGYACLGGQFWFLLADGSLYEPFWLEANSGERDGNESWPEYSSRSCHEVAEVFVLLLKKTDFEKEAERFNSLQSPFRILFNAYFVTESELASLGLR